jgi:hypothetical protein
MKKTTKTTKIVVHENDFHEFRDDLKKWKVRHMPFQRNWKSYTIEVIDSTKSSWLILKYLNPLTLS